MDLEALYAIWLRDTVHFWRRPVRILSGLARALLWLVLLGSGLRTLVTAAGLDYVHFMLPGVVVLTLLYGSLQTAVATVADREFGFLQEVLLAPVPRSTLVLGRLLGGATEATLQGCLTLALTPLLGLHLSWGALAGGIALMFLISVGVTAGGLVLAATSTRLEDFGVVANFIILPMYFLSGTLYPVQAVPVWFKVLVGLNPLSYAVDALRGVLVGAYSFPLLLDVSVIGAALVLMVQIAIPLYSRE